MKSIITVKNIQTHANKVPIIAIIIQERVRECSLCRSRSDERSRLVARSKRSAGCCFRCVPSRLRCFLRERILGDK